MLVATFDRNCGSGLCTLKCHLLDHMLEDIGRPETLSGLDSSLYKHFNVHLKEAYKRSWKRTQIRMIGTISEI